MHLGKPAWDVSRRKPAGKMIRDAMERVPLAAQEGVMFVGDMDTDEQAARDAKVPFAWAAHFFEG